VTVGEVGGQQIEPSMSVRFTAAPGFRLPRMSLSAPPLTFGFTRSR